MAQKVKIGDLVRFLRIVKGTDEYIGVVVGFNGDLPDVLWQNGETKTEPLSLLEVIDVEKTRIKSKDRKHN